MLLNDISFHYKLFRDCDSTIDQDRLISYQPQGRSLGSSHATTCFLSIITVQ